MNKKAHTIKLDVNLLKTVKVNCAYLGTSISSFTEEALREKLKTLDLGDTIVLGMGRPKSDATSLVEALQDVLEEHLWKLFVYHTFRQNDVKGWLQTLNKYIPKLHKFSIPKKGGKANFTKKSLHNKLFVEPFGNDLDIKRLIKTWTREGYPSVTPESIDVKKLEILTLKYIQCILEDEKLEVSTQELN